MKMKGMLLASLTLLSGAVMLTACSANQRKASDSKTLYLMQTGDILSLDNSNQANLTQWNVLEQSMEGMYRAGKNGKLIPAMATSIVKPTNSGRTYTYHLRKMPAGQTVTRSPHRTSSPPGAGQRHRPQSPATTTSSPASRMPNRFRPAKCLLQVLASGRWTGIRSESTWNTQCPTSTR